MSINRKRHQKYQIFTNHKQVEATPMPLPNASSYHGPSQTLINNMSEDLKDYYYYLLCDIEDTLSLMLFPEVCTDDKFTFRT